MIRVATRDSQLSIVQTQQLITDFQKMTDEQFELVPMKTMGDKNIEDRFEKVGGKGIFTKELDQALLDGRADIAIHSLKDIPSSLPESIELVAVGLQEDMRDVFVSLEYKNIQDLPKGSKIGTSSARRVAQLQYHYPHIEVVPLRGNLQTRIKKLKDLQLGGIILAASGMIRMGYQEQISSYLPIEKFVPAIGQGFLAVTATHSTKYEFLSQWQDRPLWKRVCSLRYIMKALEGGCSVPLGGVWENERLHVFLSDKKAHKVINHTLKLDQNHQETAEKMVAYLGEHGAKSMIEELKHGR